MVKRLSALDRKLVRDVWAIRGQAAAIAMVIAAGIAIFVAMLSTFDSLDLSLQTYYDRYRFGDVFASLVRAPLSRVRDIEAIPGVALVEPRVVVDVTVDVPGMTEPAVGHLVSIPADTRPALCDVFLREGRYIEPGQPDEVLASESFARAHGLVPGDSVGAVINGRRRELRIVGLALSPEFIYPVRPGELLPDEARYGVFWMERRALASAFDMEGAFNNVVLKMMRGASDREVTARLDALLDSEYGGVGALPRALQPSHFYLGAKLMQLRKMGTLVPVVFLGVGAFLLNVVLSRIVSLQRSQIAAIKALGYSHAAVAAHYVKWSVLIASAGVVIGVLGGAWLGWGLTRIYAVFFHFPVLVYRLTPGVVVGGAATGLAAAILGALGAVAHAVRLPPAEAMRPEVPATYSVSWIERAGVRRLLSQPTRIILRTLQRHPGRVALSIGGIALGGSLLVVGNFTRDAVNAIVDMQFNLAQRSDVTVTLVEPSSASALDDLRRLPGVIDAEAFRSVPVRLRFGARFRYVAVIGMAPAARLNRVVDAPGRPVALPSGGLVLSAKLAELLHVGAGDEVTLEVLEGTRASRQVPVSGVVHEYLGTSAYMNEDALHRLLGEGQTVSGAYLQVDRVRESALYRQLKATPRVAGVLPRRAAMESFETTVAEALRKGQVVYILFATIIAFGVVYNSARISLSERSRELATLRVIGFTRAEISYVLLGELAVVTCAAVPLGLLAGYEFAAVLVRATDTEMFRLPLVVSSRSYAISAVVIAMATLISGMVVRRKLDHLDLVEVLKTRE